MLNSASGSSQPGDCREEESTVRAYAPVLVIAFAFICSGRSFPQSVEKEGKAILELGAAATGVSRRVNRPSVPRSRSR
jgi:hypothetical protein